MRAVCGLCPHNCSLEPGQTGFCRARANRGGRIVCVSYGRVTSLALDPVEKKPLRHFYPGSRILSVGSFGCNLRCPFCQNSTISMADAKAETLELSPESLAAKALELASLPQGNLGAAFTYNEPLTGYEYVRDCCEQLHRAGLKTVLVTNGCFREEPVRKLLPWIDAMNIDLKGFTTEYYRWIGGDLDTVRRFIRLAAERCHVEITTLIVPGRNDAEEEMEREAAWLASVNPEIPLHVTRFFPRYQMADGNPTPVDTVMRLCRAAQKHLRFVYPGNC